MIARLTAIHLSYNVSILILLDYLFLFSSLDTVVPVGSRLNPYFTGLSILIIERRRGTSNLMAGLNPYFTGLSILIWNYTMLYLKRIPSQSLFYWIIYSYTGSSKKEAKYIVVSILILLDYLFL